MKSEQVTVVGAGPVGLVAAVSLIENGIPVVVLEASADLAVDLRASTFHPPTLEFLDKLNLADELISRGIKCPFWQFRDRKKGEIATFDLGLLKDYTNHPYRLQAEQWKLTEAARKRLDESDLATLITDISVKTIEQDSDFVTIHAERKTGEQEVYQTRFLIGADGARSTIRSETKVGFPGLTIPEIFLSLSTPFRYDQAIKDLADISYISDPNEWLVLLRTPTLWRVLFPTDPNLSDAEIIDSDRVEERMQNLLSGEPYEIKHKTAYRVHERVADKYVHGRVFLAGDAAHLNNPLGGMGMNSGIHDGDAAVEAINFALAGGDPARAVEVYSKVRRDVAAFDVQMNTQRNYEEMREQDEENRQSRRNEMEQIAADPDQTRAYLKKAGLVSSLETSRRRMARGLRPLRLALPNPAGRRLSDAIRLDNLIVARREGNGEICYLTAESVPESDRALAEKILVDSGLYMVQPRVDISNPEVFAEEVRALERAGVAAVHLVGHLDSSELITATKVARQNRREMLVLVSLEATSLDAQVLGFSDELVEAGADLIGLTDTTAREALFELYHHVGQVPLLVHSDAALDKDSALQWSLAGVNVVVPTIKVAARAS